MTTRILILCSALAVTVATAGTDASREAKTVNILFIGNSYTENLRNTFNGFMAAVSPDSHLAYRTAGGWTLRHHVADPAVEPLIASRQWDYVVLQEQSRLPTFDPDSAMYREHRQSILTLVQWIREAGATPVLYQTWGRRDGDSGAPKRSPDFDTMQAHLTRAYADAGHEAGARVVPVGQVWQAVRHADIELGRALHARDGSHASDKGSYLIAATFLRALVNVDAESLAAPATLTKSEITTINKAITQILASE